MKKPSIIIGKKQIIMTCLTLMLAVAVYINYAASPKLAPDSSSMTFRKDTDSIKYGETEFVNAPAEPAAEDYFAQARLDKMKDRDEAVQTLQTMIGGGDVKFVSAVGLFIGFSRLTEALMLGCVICIVVCLVDLLQSA